MKAIALLLALGLLAAPVAAEAEQAGKVYRFGLLSGLTRSVAERFWGPFVEELHDLGWVEGENVIIEGRYAEGRMERFPDLAAELVRLNVDVIVIGSTPATRAAINATRAIPLVFTYVSDPVASGFVASFARPGGNATGIAFELARGIGGKQVELLKETVPHASRFAVLSDPANPANHQNVGDMQRAAQALGVTLQSLEVRGPDDLVPAFSSMTREGAEALLVLDGLIIKHRRRVVDLALTNRLPTMFWHPRFVLAGGLMSYAPNHPAMMRRAAQLVDKILKGTKPADLPVERPTKFDLVINLKTAKALGLTIPPSLLFRADKVIK